MTMRTALAALRRAQGGVTTVESAIVLPVLLVTFMGLCEISYQAYLQSILTGAVQKAGRDATIQNAATSTLDTEVLDQVRAVSVGAAFASGFPKRQNYASFNTIAPEPFTDGNANAMRDPGECFTDINANGSWDADAGKTGNGSANDTVVYSARITYPRLFPVTSWLGMGTTSSLNATTILKNQPYAGSAAAATPATVCT